MTNQGAIARWADPSQERVRKALEQVRSGKLRLDPDGSIWRLWKQNRPCEPERCDLPLNTGYLSVELWENNERTRVLAHRIVHEALIGPIPIGHEINHKNGVRHDNRPENLETVTRLENARHAREVLGKYTPPPIRRGEDANTAKLTEIAVPEIRRRYAEGGVSQRALASEYGVTQAAIWHVVNGTTWGNSETTAITTPKSEKHRSKLNPDKVREIRRRFDAGESYEALAAEFGCSESAIYLTVTRRIWKNVA